MVMVSVAGGCSRPHATVELIHPFEFGSQQSVALESERAQLDLDTGDVVAQLKCEWPLPGSRYGTPQYVLYLRLPPTTGVFQIGDDISSLQSESVARDSNSAKITDEPEVVSGFLIQRTGRLEGVTHMVSGQIEVKGAKLRRGTINVTCADETEIHGTFIAKPGFRMSNFERDHRIDIANARIVATGGTIPEQSSATEPVSKEK